MNNEFTFLPEQASSIAWKTDLLYGFLWLVTIFFTVLVFCLVMYLAVRYRKGNIVDRTAGDGHDKFGMLLEITWSIIPLGLTMVMFVWGASLFFEIHEPPANTMRIHALGKQWMWKFQHPNGKRELNELHVPVNQPIRLKMISEDVIHSMYFPAFRVKQDVLPGRYTEMWFTPTKVGTYHLFCAEYCGTDHSMMIGTVTVMSENDYADWLVGGSSGDESAVELGQQVIEKHGCITCHKNEQGARAPSFVNLYGREVPLQGGGMVTADDEYIRESIYQPRAKIHAGYKSIMPTYEGQISEEEIMFIIAYLKSLSETEDEESMMGTDSADAPERDPKEETDDAPDQVDDDATPQYKEDERP